MSTDKSNHQIAKSAAVIGSATFLSRILGFIRDMVIARLFGVYLYAQAFVIAFRIPNLLRDLLGEGASNAAFVPVFTEYATKRSKEEFWELANALLNVLLVVLSLITLLGIIFSPLIVRIIAPGFISDPQKLEATIRLNRIIFPYILLVGLAAYSMGLLNSLKHFVIPAFAPCLLNISIIIFAMLYGEGIKGLASGILVGGLMQLLVQIPVLYKKGFRPRFFLNFNHPGVKSIFSLMGPRVLSSCIYQLNNFVDSVFGSLTFIVGEGGVAILYFAYRLIQFPLGIFSNALSQAILPTLSAQALEEDKTRFNRTVSFGLRATFFVMLPASVFFIVMAKPIIASLFGGGRFDIYSQDATAKVLLFYSIGLFAYGASKIVQCCFFALKDTVTPTKVAGLALVLNLIFNFVFMFPLRIYGLALATSLSGIISFVVLFTSFLKKSKLFDLSRLKTSFLKIFSASLGMGVVAATISGIRFFPGLSFISGLVNLVVLLTVLSISYISFCFIFKVPELAELWNWLKRNK